MSKRQFISFPLTLLCGFLLTACAPSETFDHTEGAVMATQSKIAEEKSGQMKNPPPVVRKTSPYVDVKPISLEQDPSWFNREVEVHGNDLPFVLFTSKIMSGADVAVNFHDKFDKYQVVSMDYSGTVHGALSMLAAKTGSAFKAQERRIHWTDMSTRSFNVSFMPGEADYLMGRTGGGGTESAGSGGGSSIQQVTATTSQDAFSNLKGSVSVWKDLETNITNLLSGDGKSVVSQATTTVTVTDHIQNIKAVENFLTELNENLSRQVLLKVLVLDVLLDKQYTYGVDWSLLRRQFGKNFSLTGNFSNPANLPDNSNFGALKAFFDPRTIGTEGNTQLTTDSRNAGSSLLIQALETQGKVSVVTRPEVVTLNNQVAEVAIINQTAYLASITTTVEDGVSQTSLEPGIVTAGFSLYVLPKIQDKKVYLQITTSLSNLESIDSVSAGGTGTGANSSAIQIPELSEKYFNQRSMLISGESLILAGFKSLDNRTSKSKNFGSDAIGGEAAIRRSSETIVILTPYIMGGHHDPHVTAMRPIDGGFE